jgi:hypothetical protein
MKSLALADKTAGSLMPFLKFVRQCGSLKTALQDLVALHRLSWNEVEETMMELHLSPNLMNHLPCQLSGGKLQ